MPERCIEGPNTYPELRSRVAGPVGEKMVHQGGAPRQIGEVEDGYAQPGRGENQQTAKRRESTIAERPCTRDAWAARRQVDPQPDEGREA